MKNQSQGALPAQLLPPPQPPEISRRTWLALATLLLGMFVSLLDSTIVNVALPTIRSSLNADEATLSWIISGYSLTFGIALIPAGRLGDRFGHKSIFIIGVTVFVLSSVASGLSQNSVELVIARVIQGLGGGIFFPAITALIQIMFPPQKLGRAFGFLGATIGISTALGPLAGGLLIQAFGSAHGWRSIFFVNLPLGIVTSIAAAVLLPTGGISKRLSSDVVGLLLAASALVAILVPLIQGQDDGWPLWTYFSLAGGAILLILFALWERRVSRGPQEPLVPPHLFSHLSFTGGVVLALVYFAAFTSIFFTISLLWQAGLGHTALQSGLVSVPFSVGTILGAWQSDRLARRLGRTALSIGTGLVAAGLIALVLVVGLVPTPNLVNWDLLGPLLVIGTGSGLFIAPNSRFIVATVDGSEAGAASGVIGTMQRVGAAIGIAVIGSVFFGSLPASFTPSHAQVARLTEDNLHTGPAAIREAIAAFTQHTLAVDFGQAAVAALSVSTAFAVLAFLLVFALPRRVTITGAEDSHGRADRI